MFHHNTYEHSWPSTDKKMHDQIDNTLIDRRQHSSIIYAQSSRGADSDKTPAKLGTDCQ